MNAGMRNVGPVAKLDFIEAMARDRMLTGLPLRVGIELMHRLNRETGVSRPSLMRLANDLDASERGVVKAVSILVSLGWYRRKIGGGRGCTTRYEPNLERVNCGSGLTKETLNCGSENTELPFQKTLNQSAYEPVKGNPLIEPNNVEFQNWYDLYPKKVARGHAEKAFKAALKLASVDELMEGVKRYVERVRSEVTSPQYIKNPATWLNAKCWLDEDSAEPAITHEKIKGEIAHLEEKDSGNENPRPDDTPLRVVSK